jgi:hypothetical protein
VGRIYPIMSHYILSGAREQWARYLQTRTSNPSGIVVLLLLEGSREMRDGRLIGCLTAAHRRPCFAARDSAFWQIRGSGLWSARKNHVLRERGLMLEYLLEILDEGALELCAALTSLLSLPAAFSDLRAAGGAVFLPRAVRSEEQHAADRTDPGVGETLPRTEARVERRRQRRSDLILRVCRIEWGTIDGLRGDHLAVGLFGRELLSSASVRQSVGI